MTMTKIDFEDLLIGQGDTELARIGEFPARVLNLIKGNQTMPRGGARTGAGRPGGAVSKKSREVAERAIRNGITPLEVMLDNMRFYHSEAGKLTEKLIAEGAPQLEVAKGGETQGPHANVIEAIKTVLGFRKMAGEEAARAAPYIHPRQGVAGDGEQGDPEFVPLAERIAYYTRRDDLKAAGDKVVELKPQKPQGDQGA